MDSQSPNDDLCNAVAAGDAAGVSSAVQRGANPNSTLAWGRHKNGPVLCLAVANENSDVVGALLEAPNIDPNSRGDCPATPLYDAVLKSNPTITQLLLFNKANPNIASGSLLTPPLVAAAFNGQLAICRLLLQALPQPADVEGTSKNGFFPLYSAAERGHLEVVQLLYDYGADPSRRRAGAAAGRRYTPAEYARLFGHTSTATWLDGRKKLTKRIVEDDEVGPGATYRHEKGIAIFLNYETFASYEITDAQGNKKIVQPKARDGAQEDAKNIKKTFEPLGFEVCILNNLDSSQTEYELRSFSKNPRLWYVDTIAVIIGSHGGNRTRFLTADSKEFEITRVKDFFSNEECPAMKNKSKYVIANACRGNFLSVDDFSTERITHEVTFQGKVHKATHVIDHLVTLYACSEDNSALRNIFSGSHFLTCLCTTIRENPKDEFSIIWQKTKEALKKVRDENRIPIPLPQKVEEGSFCRFFFKSS